MIIGVENRIEEVAKFPEGHKPANAKPFHKLLPLHELLALTTGKNMQTQTVWRIYDSLISEFENEFNILLHVTKEKLAKNFDMELVELILRNREQKIKIDPGFDGEYGVALLGEKQRTLI